MNQAELGQKILDMVKRGATEAEIAAAIEAARPRVGSIRAGRNINIGKTITIVNGERKGE